MYKFRIFELYNGSFWKGSCEKGIWFDMLPYSLYILLLFPCHIFPPQEHWLFHSKLDKPLSKCLQRGVQWVRTRTCFFSNDYFLFPRGDQVYAPRGCFYLQLCHPQLKFHVKFLRLTFIYATKIGLTYCQQIFWSDIIEKDCEFFQ